MRFFFLLLFHALFHAVFVASDLLVWVTEDLVGGRDVSVKYNNLNLLPILEDLAFFEIVVFTGSNDKPVSLNVCRAMSVFIHTREFPDNDIHISKILVFGRQFLQIKRRQRTKRILCSQILGALGDWTQHRPWIVSRRLCLPPMF